MKKREKNQEQRHQTQRNQIRGRSDADQAGRNWSSQDRSVRNGHTQEEMDLYQELDQYRKCGCAIYLNGKPSAPGRIVSACLREGGDYMRDFVSDEQERIQRIDFIKINHKK